MRVIRVTDEQLINSKIEAIKKKRDRYFKKYKKTKDLKYLQLSKSFSHTLKDVIKKRHKGYSNAKLNLPTLNTSGRQLTKPLVDIMTPLLSWTSMEKQYPTQLH